MSVSTWLSWPLSGSHARRDQRRNPASHPKRARLFLEQLEGRVLLSTYNAATVSALIADIQAANTAGGANTITLTAPTGSPYRLASSLPNIAVTDNLTIVGNSDNTIEPGGRSSYLIGVAPGSTLTLDNLQVHGFTDSGGTGGAIYNQGALTLSAVTVISNESFALSQGSRGQGGAIWSSGSLTLDNGTLFSGNYTRGGAGDAPAGTEPPLDPYGPELPPGNAYGGAVYIAGGTAKISDTTFTGNYAEGGINTDDGAGGAGFGGALYVAGGQVVVTATSINGNQAIASFGGVSYGAGVFVAGGTVTVANCTLDSNTSVGAGHGGALFVAGGTVALTSDTVESNTATYGGGLCFAAGTVTLTNCTVQANTATYGGGLYVGAVTLPNASDTGVYTASGATVYLDPYTVANTINNTDSSGTNGSTANIDGKYILT